MLNITPQNESNLVYPYISAVCDTGNMVWCSSSRTPIHRLEEMILAQNTMLVALKAELRETVIVQLSQTEEIDSLRQVSPVSPKRQRFQPGSAFSPRFLQC